MKVSSIDGRRQQPWLKSASWILGGLALVGTAVPGDAGEAVSGLAVVLVILIPLLRVVWVTFRFAQDRDRRFVMIGMAVLGVVAFGILFPVVIA